MSHTVSESDLDALRSLNRDYIASVRNGDARRFNEILDADFVCSDPDGTLVERERFLARTTPRAKVADLEAHEVLIRMFGDTAIIHARTSFTRPNGEPGSGRYTDVWVRRAAGWHCVSAHVTRL